MLRERTPEAKTAYLQGYAAGQRDARGAALRGMLEQALDTLETIAVGHAVGAAHNPAMTDQVIAKMTAHRIRDQLSR